MDRQKIFDEIEARQNELFELLCSLININSENDGFGGNEREIAEYIHKICKETGLESEMYSPLDVPSFCDHPDYFNGKDLKNRFNVTACMKGKSDGNGLMLMAHNDTVEAGNRENWNTNPFEGKVENGRVYGRGACDDKYAIAAALFVIKLLKEQGFEPKQNLLFSAYCDEEHGGSHGALAAVLKYKCDNIVNMDGRENQIWHCGSGGGEMKYIFHTKEPKDSAKTAARAMQTVLDVLEEFGNNRQTELENNRFYKGTVIPSTSMRYMGITAGKGGTDLGTGEVWFTFYTDKSKDEIYEEFHMLHKKLEKELLKFDIIGDGFVPNTRFFHYVFCEPDSSNIRAMVEASRMATGKEPIVCGSCLSDLSVISKYGSSKAFGFGAGREFSHEGGAHQPNEFIECRKLVDYVKTIAAYVINTLG